MKFMRRPDIDNVARIHIAVQAFLGLGVYGEITRIAHGYEVSRLFVSKLLWQLLTLYELTVCVPAAAVRKEADRSILLLRLEGHCSLEHISQIMKQLALPWSSVGSLSQTLTAYAKTLPKEVLTGCQIVFLLCDELFTLGRPILLTVEPKSLAILKIALAENREAETWKTHWHALADAGLITQQTVVADQGAGLVKGCALMGLTHHPDVFHLLRPVALCGERLYRQALAAIAREYDRGHLESGRTGEVLNKRLAAYAVAKALAEERIERYDNCCDLWAELRKTLELFDSHGKIIALTSRQAEIKAIIEMMREGGCIKLQQALTSFAAGLEGYWGSYQRAEEVTQGLLTRYPRGVVEALACGWQVARQSINSKDSGIRKRLAQEAEWYNAYAAHLLPAHAEAIRQEVGEALDAEVRSASLVENVNSALRPLLETCRGQVEQEMVELFAYVHNHRRFVRGKRAGKAPIELLTGKAIKQTWLDSL